jgi:hypothetical protein
VPYNTLNNFSTTIPDNNTSRDLTGQTYVLGFLIHNGAYSNPLGPDNWWIDSVFGSLTPFTSPVWMYEAIEYTTAGGFPYNGVFAYFQALQAAGAKVLVSLGGESFTVADISNTTVATNLAQSICFSLLGQSCPNPLGWTALTTDAGQPFAFDGVDIDFESDPVADVTTMTVLLSTLRANAGINKLITSAPQTPYMYVGGYSGLAYNANGAYFPYLTVNDDITTYKTDTPGSPALLDVNYIGNFSQINWQFYNQGAEAAVYPGESNFVTALAKIGYFSQKAITTNKPLVNIGLLGGTDGTYPEPIPAVGTLAQNIVTGVLAAHALILAQIPGLALNNWFNGIMFWESPEANIYAEQVVVAIQAINTTIPVNLVLYGGQNWATPGISNPGWTTSITPPPPPGPPPPAPNTYTLPLGAPDPSGVPNNATVNINLVFVGSFSYNTIINQILFNIGSPSVSPSLQSFVNTALSTNLNNGFFNSIPPTLTRSSPNTIMNVSFALANYTSVTPSQLITALLGLPSNFGTTGYTLVYGSSNIVYTIP